MQNVLFLLGPSYAGKYFFFHFMFTLLVIFFLPGLKVDFVSQGCWKHSGCVLCVGNTEALLEAPHVPQGTSFAPASSLCPVLIPPGSPCLHWLPAQFGDFTSEKRSHCGLGRGFLETALWYWDRVYTSALCSSAVLCRAGSVPVLAGQGTSPKP